MKRKQATLDAFVAPDAPQATPDDVQHFINFIVERAEYGVQGSISSSGSRRRVLTFGEPYYWTSPSPLPLSAMPDSLRNFLHSKGMEKFNSILCNVYDQRCSRIARHQDNTSLLAPADGEVISISLARRSCDREKQLATMRFDSPQGVELVELHHGTIVRFDAHADKRSGRSHQVNETLLPRVNLTLRHVKEQKKALSRG